MAPEMMDTLISMTELMSGDGVVGAQITQIGPDLVRVSVDVPWSRVQAVVSAAHGFDGATRPAPAAAAAPGVSATRTRMKVMPVPVIAPPAPRVDFSHIKPDKNGRIPLAPYIIQVARDNPGKQMRTEDVLQAIEALGWRSNSPTREQSVAKVLRKMSELADEGGSPRRRIWRMKSPDAAPTE